MVTHLPNRISVSKSPGNGANPPPEFDPDTPIPYALTFQNTGSWPMTGLKLTDQIATNAKGSLLVWPDDENGTPTPSYSFALTGSNGATKPTTGFSVVLDTATGLLTVRVPAGFVFQPGDKLVVTTNLVFQQALDPGTAVVNEVTATSDRIFDTCTHTYNNRPNGSISNVDECSAPTTVEPSALSPIRATKSVRGVGAGVPGTSPGDPNYDDLGVIQQGFGSTASSCESPNASNGFYRYPCVPITRAGGVERWQLSLSNQGNIPVGVLAGIDVLPAPGDKGVTINAARESRWAATLLGNFRNDAGTVDPERKDLRIYYSTTVPNVACNAADIRDELLRNGLPTTDPCYADVNSRSWIQVTGATTPAQLATARALKATVNYAEADTGVGLEPGSTINVTFDTATAPYAAVAEQPALDPIAWNSFAAGARGTFDGVDQVTSIVEPRKVGVALSSGRFDLLKRVVQPDGASFPLPATYPFKMRCSSVGQDIPIVDTTGKDVSVVQLTRDQVMHVNGGNPASAWGRVNIPRYATCTLTELGSQGSTVTFDPAGGTPGTSGTITALRDYSTRQDIANPAYPSPIDLEQVTATNTYRPAGFTVSKSVVQGGALDEDGNPVTVDDTFGFTAGCTFNGVNVVPTADRTFSLRGGASKTFTGLPAGASCTVTETSSGSSSSTSHVLTQGATQGPPVAGKTLTFALAADDAGQHVNAVGFTNTYTVGSVNVTKNVAPAGAPWGDRNFTLRLVCTLANASPTPVYDATQVVDRTNNTWRVDNLPTGASCTVTEPQTGGANSTTITPNNGTFTVGNASVVQVTATNTFTLGAIRVTKRVTGDTTELPAALTGTYTVSLSCIRLVNGLPLPVVPIPGGAERVLNGNGATTTYSGLPTGATCQVTETGSDPQAQSTTVAPTSVTVGASEATPVAVSVTNNFKLGSLRVTKSVLGAGGPLYGQGPYEVSLACTVDRGGTATPIAIPGGAVRTLAPGSLTTTYTQLPVGAECTLTETDVGGANSTAISVRSGGGGAVVTDGTSADVVIRDDTASTGTGTPAVIATVQNTFAVGAVRVTKELEGDGAAYVNGPFTMRIACTREVSGATVAVTIPGGPTRTLTRAAPQAQWTPLPEGAVCRVTETDDAGAGSHVVLPDTVTVGGLTEEVTATNTFEPAGFSVSKSVDDGGAVNQDGTPIERRETYSFTTACTLAGNPLALPADYRAFTLQRDEVQDLSGLPVGAECTVTETDSGTAGSTTHVVTENGAEGASQDGTTTSVTLGADTAGEHVNSVAFTNHYTVGSVLLTKQAIGPGDVWADNQFRVQLRCTLDDASPSVVFDDFRFLDIDERTWQVDNLPTGAVCEFSEDPDNDGGANFTILDPESGQVTVGAGTTVDARVYNLFGLGAIRVSKAVTGDTDELPESLTGDYTVSLDCTRLINGTEFDITIPGGAQRTLDGDGGTATYLGLPTGATCRVTETGSDPQSQETTVEPGTVTVNANENDPVQVQVTNTFHLGSVLVTKQVDGPGADLYGQGPFEVSLACTADVAGLTRDVPVPGGAERTLDTANSLSTRYDQLPVGARCTLTETRTGGANTSTVAVTTQGGSTVETKGTRADLVVVDDTASSDDGSPAGVTAEVTNRFALGQARVTKRLTGIGADYVDGPFTMRIECTREVDGKQVPVPIPGGSDRILSRDTALNDVWTDLPTAATCSVTEPRDGGAARTTISPERFRVRDAAASEVRVVNMFDGSVLPPSSEPGAVSPAGAGLSGDELGDTGSPVRPWMVALGLACLVIGAALSMTTRRLRR